MKAVSIRRNKNCLPSFNCQNCWGFLGILPCGAIKYSP